MALARAAVNRLYIRVFKRHDFSFFIKLRLLDACVVYVG